MQTLWLFIKALPDLIKLLQAMQAMIDEAETKRKVTDDLKILHEAFRDEDASKIHAIFNS